MPVVLNLEDKIISLIRQESYKWFTTGVNLGGITGVSGGTGGPLGGFTGQLPQSKVTYDLSEAETWNVPVSGESLLYNLNRIRYRIAQLESGSGIGSGISYITVRDESVDQGDVTILDFKGGGVTASVSGSIATITITASGSAAYLNDLLDVTILSPSSGDLLYYDAVSGWVNLNPTEIGLSEIGHTHLESDITDLEHDAVKLQGYAISTSTPSINDSLVWNGSQWAPALISGSSSGSVLEYALYFEDLSSQVPGSGFTLAYEPVSGSLQVHHDGILQQPDNYYMTGTTTFVTLFDTDTDDELLVQYLHQQGNFGIDIYDDGSKEGTAITELDFIGGDVTISGIRAYITISGGSGSGHDPITVVDTSSLNLELTAQALSGYVIPGGVDHDQLLNFTSTEHFTEGSISHINIQDIGINTHPDIDAHIASGYIHTPSGHIHDNRYYTETELDIGQLDNRYYTETEINTWKHDAITVTDTASLNLELTAQALSGYVIPSGIDHNSLANLTTDNPHSQYSLSGHAHDYRYYTETEIDVWKHDAVTVTDTASLNLELTGQTLSGYVLDNSHNHIEANITDLEHDAIKLQGRAISTTVPDNGQSLVWNSSNNAWQPQTISGGAGGGVVVLEDLTSQVPAGSDNFYVSATAASGSLHVFLNGILQQPDNYYTLSASGFHTLFSPISGDELVVEYFSSDISGSIVGHDPITVTDTASLNLELTGQAISGYVIPGGVNHDQLLNFAANEHFTEASIDHTNIQNIGSNTHDQLDAHVASGSIHFTEGSISHLNIQDIGSNTHSQIDSHIGDTSIHFDELGELSDVIVTGATQGESLVYDGADWVPSGVQGHDLVTVTDTASLNLELTNQALSGYVIPGGVDHDQLLNFEANEHFTEASIDHTNIQNIGTTTHDQLDAHVVSGSIHFTESSISHLNIQNIGSNTHSQIDSHIGDTSIHFDVIGELSDVTVGSASQGDSLVYDGADWIPSGVQGTGGHDAVTVTDTTSLNLELTGQALSGYVIDNSHNHLESNITNLSHDAVKIQGRTVSSSAPDINDSLVWTGTQWAPIAISGGSAAADVLHFEDLTGQVPGSGFTISYYPVLSGTMQLYLNGLLQQPNNYYLSSDTTVTTLFNTVSGDEIAVQYLTGNTFAVASGGGGVTDHGDLTGLLDDDHPQYPQISVAETISGAWIFANTFEQRYYYFYPYHIKTQIVAGLIHVTDSSTGFDTTANIRGNNVTILGNNGVELANFAPTTIVFNDPGNDIDFRVESDTNSHALFVQGSDGYVGIGQNAPDQLLHVGSGGGTVMVHLDSGAAGRVTQIEFDRGAGSWFGPTSGDEFHLWSAENIPIIIAQNNIEKLRIGTSETVINEQSTNYGFRVESSTQTDALAVDGSTGYVTIHSVKTTTGDPSGSEGMIYYNTTDNVIKMYADGAWRTLASW